MTKKLCAAHDFDLVHDAAVTNYEKVQDSVGVGTWRSEAFVALRVRKSRVKAKSCGLRTGDFKGGFGFDSTMSDYLISMT